MQIFHKEFKNELGNTINVQVEPKEIEGVAGIIISISGPTSLSENHITLEEARVLFDQLGLVLTELDTQYKK